MWSDLSSSWQACFTMAWEAYSDDCFPIGVVISSADGIILSRGRDCIYEKNTHQGCLPGDELAHAEAEELHALDFAVIDPHLNSAFGSGRWGKYSECDRSPLMRTGCSIASFI